MSPFTGSNQAINDQKHVGLLDSGGGGERRSGGAEKEKKGRRRRDGVRGRWGRRDGREEREKED